MIQAEGLIVRKIRTYLERVGAWSIKVHGGPAQEIGIPDILACYKGRFLAIEVKVPGKRDTVTPRQSLQKERIESAGGLSLIVTSVDEVSDMIQELEVTL